MLRKMRLSQNRATRRRPARTVMMKVILIHRLFETPEDGDGIRDDNSLNEYDD